MRNSQRLLHDAFLIWQLLRSRQLARAVASSEANFHMLAEGSSDTVTRIGLDDVVR